MTTYVLKYSESNITMDNIHNTNWKFKDKELKVLKIANGTILPYKKCRNMTYGLGGVLDDKGCFVEESGFVLPITVSEKLELVGNMNMMKRNANILKENVYLEDLLIITNGDIF